ncbi:hypothetical protein GBF35_25765 [Nonomuraea phyllanthi]|uniref:hypothetical protein n=1 Tax=Nonomuraea phyllanthi TaxID=2219224 RepID=UPI001293F9EB|nr:hypothetical protein [Nonomuraea phyllanthi]QFY09607.1 hypothetical protein GBF35_25765 [Nonomuraea phyllanthi]
MTSTMTLTDWRGVPYTIGTLIVYPRGSGGAIEVQEGEVLDIWEAVYDTDVFRWVRYEPNNTDHDGLERVTRVKVQPTGRCSREPIRHQQLHYGEQGHIVFDENGRPVLVPAKAKPVVLLITENITVATPDCQCCTPGQHEGADPA